jgi:hypothetical protein
VGEVNRRLGFYERFLPRLRERHPPRKGSESPTSKPLTWPADRFGQEKRQTEALRYRRSWYELTGSDQDPRAFAEDSSIWFARMVASAGLPRGAFAGDGTAAFRHRLLGLPERFDRRSPE